MFFLKRLSSAVTEVFPGSGIAAMLLIIQMTFPLADKLMPTLMTYFPWLTLTLYMPFEFTLLFP